MSKPKHTKKTKECAAYIHGLILQNQRSQWGHARYEGESDWHASVTDLLADVQHFCHVQGIDFDDALRVSRDHFDYEISKLQREDEEEES